MLGIWVTALPGYLDYNDGIFEWLSSYYSVWLVALQSQDGSEVYFSSLFLVSTSSSGSNLVYFKHYNSFS